MSEIDRTAIELDLSFGEIPVTLKDPKTGESLDYTIRELTGTERDNYMQNLGSRTAKDKDGSTRVRNFKGIQAALLVLCMQDSEGKNVTEKVVQAWPARVQSMLYERASKLSGLDDKAEDDAGND